MSPVKNCIVSVAPDHSLQRRLLGFSVWCTEFHKAIFHCSNISMCGPAETVMETFQYHPNHSQPSDKHTDKGKQSQNYIQPSQSQEETMKINCIVNDGKLINEDLLLCWSQAAVGQAAAALSCNVFGTSLKGPKFSHGNTPPSTIKATFFLTRHLRCTQIKFLGTALLALRGLNNLNGQVPLPIH